MTNLEIDATTKANTIAQYRYVNMHFRNLHNVIGSEEWEHIGEDMKKALDLKYKALVMLNIAMQEELKLYGATEWLID